MGAGSSGVSALPILPTTESISGIDWKAASRRHCDGDVVNSVHVNKERFGFDDREYHMYLDIAEIVGSSDDKYRVNIYRNTDEEE